MIVFTINEHRNIYITRLNRQAGYATDYECEIFFLFLFSRSFLVLFRTNGIRIVVSAKIAKKFVTNHIAKKKSATSIFFLCSSVRILDAKLPFFVNQILKSSLG